MSTITTQSEKFQSPGGLQTIESYTPYMVCSPILHDLCGQLGIAGCYSEIAPSRKNPNLWCLVRGETWPGQHPMVINKAKQLGYYS